MPNLMVKLFEAETQSCIEHLNKGLWDAIIVADQLDDHMLIGKKLFRESFYLAMPKKHPLAQQKTVSAKKIKDHEILLLDEGHCLRDQSIEYCERINKPFQQQFFGTSLETLVSMVALGEGITLVPALSVKTFKHYQITIRPLSPSPFRQIYLYWRKTSGRTVCAETLATIIQSLELSQND